VGQLIILFGKSSQTAMTLYHLGFNCLYISRNEIDLLDPKEILKILNLYNPRLVINLASFNDVEDAEKNKLVFEVNSHALKYISQYCESNQCTLLHISTDYVFNGLKGNYTEKDICEPINKYGLSKLKGEEIIKENLQNHIILRTSWLYSHFNTKNNFLTKILNAVNNDRYDFFGASDIYGSPTSSISLARAIITICNHLKINSAYFGTFHFCDEGRVSRFEFIQEILKGISEHRNIDFNKFRIKEVKNSYFNLKAPRPMDTSIKSDLFLKLYNYTSLNWKESLTNTIIRL